MDYIKGIGVAVLLAIFFWRIFDNRAMRNEIGRNETHKAPSDQQLRWHIRHMRQDISALVQINAILLVVVVFALLFK